jgi:hypothetical protein
MPFTGDTHNLTAGSTFPNGTPSDAVVQHNAPLEDISAALTFLKQRANHSGVMATTALSGTLQAAQFPALTGPVTTSAGSLATTLSLSKAQLDAAVTDGNVLYVGDISQYTDELAQDAIGGMIDATLEYVDGTPLLRRAALTGDATAAAGSNALSIPNQVVGIERFSFLQSGTGGVTRVARDKERETVTPEDFGALGDTISHTGNASITSGAAALTLTGANFVVGDQGKPIVVPGAGASGAPLVTTILTWTDATHVTLAANASTTLSAVSKMVIYGTDDTTALTNWAARGGALAGGKDKFYLISAEIPLVSNTYIDGRGAKTTCITRIRSHFAFVSKANLTIRDWVFDLAQPVLPTYTSTDYSNAIYYHSSFNSGIFSPASTNVLIEACRFENIYTMSILANAVAGYLRIENNDFASLAQPQNVQSQHITIINSTGEIVIDRNGFKNAAPSASDFGVGAVHCAGTTEHVSITNNRMEYCGREAAGGHPLGAITMYGDHSSGLILNNHIDQSLAECIRLTDSRNFVVDGNYMRMSSLSTAGKQIISIEGTFAFSPVGCDNIKITKNTFDQDSSTIRIGILAIAFDYSCPTKRLWIEENTFIGTKQAYYMFGPFDKVFIERNVLIGANGNAIRADFGTVTADNGVTEAQSLFGDIVIRGNHGQSISGANIQPVYLDWIKAPAYTGNFGRQTISDNIFDASTALTTTAINVRGTTDHQSGTAYIEHNKVTNYGALCLTYDIAKAIVKKNELRGTYSNTILTSGLGLLERSGNSFGTGASAGRAVLVAGTVTVTTNEVLTGDNIVLSRVVAGGTHGDLTVGTITNVTSFVINSNNAADTSTVYWEIRH